MLVGVIDTHGMLKSLKQLGVWNSLDPVRINPKLHENCEFFVVERDPAAPPVRAHVVLNWFDELKALVPIP